MSAFDIEQYLEIQSRKQRERIKAFLHEKGRPDLVAELDQKYKEIDSGIMQARATWGALSMTQREALFWAAKRGRIVRSSCTIGLRTWRSLIARELVACDGGAFDPEAALIITERGKFVLKYGREKEETTS